MTRLRVAPVSGTGGSHQRGFALVAAVFALVIIAAMVAGGYFIAAQQLRVAGAGPQASSALYSAEAGLSAMLAGWDPVWADSTEPGATVGLMADQLVSGDGYEVRLTRLDTGLDQRAAYYLASAIGRAHGPRGGRRQIALFLRVGRFAGLCCEAALSAMGPVRVATGAVVQGSDVLPGGWQSVAPGCQGLGPGAEAGILGEALERVVVAAGAVVEGEPPVAEIGRAGSDPLADFDTWYWELEQRADVRYAGGIELPDIAPAVGTDGACDESAPGNWGAPADPGHPCFGHLPIIYVGGDLRIRSPGRGQGILLVDGDLELGGDFDFYGIVAVRGRLVSGEGGGRVHGGLLARNAGLDTVRVGAGTELTYSRCAVQRALQSPKLHLPQPLADFAWFEILE